MTQSISETYVKNNRHGSLKREMFLRLYRNPKGIHSLTLDSTIVIELDGNENTQERLTNMFDKQTSKLIEHLLSTVETISSHFMMEPQVIWHSLESSTLRISAYVVT